MSQRLLAVSTVGGLAMTAWDLVMDPVMVYNGHWVWDVDGAYHGIPLQNFWGWWLTVFTTYALYLLIAGKSRQPAAMELDGWAVASYFVTMLGLVIPLLARGAGELALIGIFAMSPWVIAGWLRVAGK